MASLRSLSGFWSRTVARAKQQTNVAISASALYIPTKPYPMIQFTSPDTITTCKTMSDRGIGGFSSAELAFEQGNTPPLDLTQDIITLLSESKDIAPRNAEPPHALFSGNISTELPRNRPEIMRTGFAGWRTRDIGYSLFGKGLFDLGQYNAIVMRVKSDGRKYFVNIQTDSVVPTDLHQHVLPVKTPGQWETVIIPFSSFVRTNQGMVIEPQNEMNSAKIRSIGISLTDRIPKPYQLRIAEIWASTMTEARNDSGIDVHEEERTGFMEDPRPKRKPGEPEKILM